MKKILSPVFAGFMMILLLITPTVSNGQNEKSVANKYLTKLPAGPVSNALQKYRMTAVYTNRDLYGNFTGKTKVSGDYTRGLENSLVSWNNIYISGSNSFSDPFPSGAKQEYMENIKYVPSAKMLEADAFKNFPAKPESVFAKNLVWDMMMIENFAWNYSDSLKLNRNYIIPGISGDFALADIGTYSHVNIKICWTGISLVNNKLCAVIEYRALDNKIEMNLEQMKTRGTEQYWGTTWVALKDRQIERAEIYGGTIQEIEITGMKDKFLFKTIRELEVNRIQ
jgi:hypothetical protein